MVDGGRAGALVVIIETQGLTRQFGSRAAVNGVTFSLPEGAAMALVGANGAGKTTMMRILLNILRPTSGSARVFGKASTELRAGDFERIGYASENLELPLRMSVASYFDYLRPLYPRWDVKLETRLRGDFGLPPERQIGKLSHGMRVKTMLASALAFRPPLLVLDEPLGGLDPAIRDDVLEGLIDRAADTTILMSTHELADIEGFATHVAFMQEGVLLFEDEIDTLVQRMREVHVTTPAPCDRPFDLPGSWLAPKRKDRALQFSDQDFVSEAELRERLAAAGLTVDKLEVRPLSLREIAVALMRSKGGEHG